MSLLIPPYLPQGFPLRSSRIPPSFRHKLILPLNKGGGGVKNTFVTQNLMYISMENISRILLLSINMLTQNEFKHLV